LAQLENVARAPYLVICLLRSDESALQPAQFTLLQIREFERKRMNQLRFSLESF
jgi:hypothetical protein